MSQSLLPPYEEINNDKNNPVSKIIESKKNLIVDKYVKEIMYTTQQYEKQLADIHARQQHEIDTFEKEVIQYIERISIIENQEPSKENFLTWLYSLIWTQKAR